MVYSRNFSSRGVECPHSPPPKPAGPKLDAPISSVWPFEHSGHLLGLGGLRDSLPSYLCYLSLAVNCRCNYQLLELELFLILLEYTHCNYNELLLSFRVFSFLLLYFSCLLSCPVYHYGMCICITMFGLVYCVPLHCCDTTPCSRTGISINLT